MLDGQGRAQGCCAPFLSWHPQDWEVQSPHAMPQGNGLTLPHSSCWVISKTSDGREVPGAVP